MVTMIALVHFSCSVNLSKNVSSLSFYCEYRSRFPSRAIALRRESCCGLFTAADHPGRSSLFCKGGNGSCPTSQW